METGSGGTGTGVPDRYGKVIIHTSIQRSTGHISLRGSLWQGSSTGASGNPAGAGKRDSAGPGIKNAPGLCV